MNKTVFITGGSRGIGAAAVRLFHSRGYNTAFCFNKSDENAKKLTDELSGVFSVRGDVSSEDDVVRMAAEVTKHFGRIDILVNNAGISSFGLVTDIDAAEWKRIFDINVLGTFLTVKHIAPQMISRKSGKIINVSSMWGRCGASCESCYSASKGAVIAFSKSLAKELGPSGINVNCVAPGFIDTDMNSGISKEDSAAFCADTPLGRIGSAEEAAESIFFLASERADFITGQIISPDGGAVI